MLILKCYSTCSVLFSWMNWSFISISAMATAVCLERDVFLSYVIVLPLLQGYISCHIKVPISTGVALSFPNRISQSKVALHELLHLFQEEVTLLFQVSIRLSFFHPLWWLHVLNLQFWLAVLFHKFNKLFYVLNISL